MFQALSIDINLETWTPAAPPAEDSPQAIIRWAADRFSDHDIAVTTSFGMEGVVLLDMLAKVMPAVRVIYVDTGFLFPETLRLRDRLASRLQNLAFEPVYPILDADQQAERFGDQLWKHDPDFCCRMRKVEPLYRIIQGVDVWFAGLRRDQSSSRWNIKVVDWDWQYQLIKICPLATWTRLQVYEYIVKHDLPYNELHDRNYPTVGCTHCTRPVEGANPWDYSRDGRWNETSKTECGLHGGGI
jgi:phosphoadenosine phosphosulfate reductase